MSEKKSSIEQMFALAFQHQKNGNPKDAEILYKNILKSQPNHWKSLGNLGILAEQSNRYDKAKIFLQEALQIEPNNEKLHYNLGIVFEELVDIKQALNCYKKAWQINNDYENAIKKISFLLGGYKLDINLIQEKQIEELFLTLFKRNDINHNHIINNAIKIFYSDHVLKSIINDKAPILKNFNIQKLLRKELFILIMQKSIITNKIYEQILTRIRKEILFAINDINFNNLHKNFDFIISLAEQCFLNEYIFNQSEKETNEILLLKNSILKKNEINELKVAIFSCYTPLYNNKIIANKLLKYQSSNKLFNDLISLQVRNLLKEKELTYCINSFGKITDVISQKVKKQYESYPYPRWRYTYKNSPVNFLSILYNKIKMDKIKNNNKFYNPNVLVAGCGTGQHVLDVCNYQNAKILAVDLSLTSLSYAKRKTDELEIKNVEYLHADILQLKKLKRKFDVIEAAGVLHHMKDPLKGLKIIVDLLEPHGFLKLGLYSKTARKHIIEAKNFVKKNQFKNTREDIRRFRNEIFNLTENTSLKEVTKLQDFYSMSNVKDLIFHVKEHLFTLPQISKILDDFKLIFLCFNDIKNLVKSKFSIDFPDDKNFTSLKNWDQFETNNPNTFTGMYNFWVKKMND